MRLTLLLYIRSVTASNYSMLVVKKKPSEGLLNLLHVVAFTLQRRPGWGLKREWGCAEATCARVADPSPE
jgi:hypothetical protein